jgi:hypothetical protein
MTNALLLIVALGGIALAFVIVPMIVEGILRFRKGLHVVCPESGELLDVGVTARSAARWNFMGPGSLRVAKCPRWPDRKDCDQTCLPQS